MNALEAARLADPTYEVTEEMVQQFLGCDKEMTAHNGDTEFNFGQGAYIDAKQAKELGLRPDRHYTSGRNPLYVHLTDAGIRRVLKEAGTLYVTGEDAVYVREHADRLILTEAL